MIWHVDFHRGYCDQVPYKSLYYDCLFASLGCLWFLLIETDNDISAVRGQITCLVALQVKSKMASGGVVQVFFALIFACLFEQVAAFDGGDAAALIIGLILGIMGICACLGAYARRQQGV